MSWVDMNIEEQHWNVIVQALAKSDFAEKFVPVALKQIAKMHSEIIFENKFYHPEDMCESYELMIACTILLKYYGVNVKEWLHKEEQNTDESQSQDTTETAGRNESRKVRSKKGRKSRKTRPV